MGGGQQEEQQLEVVMLQVSDMLLSAALVKHPDNGNAGPQPTAEFFFSCSRLSNRVCSLGRRNSSGMPEMSSAPPVSSWRTSCSTTGLECYTMKPPLKG